MTSRIERSEGIDVSASANLMWRGDGDERTGMRKRQQEAEGKRWPGSDDRLGRAAVRWSALTRRRVETGLSTGRDWLPFWLVDGVDEPDSGGEGWTGCVSVRPDGCTAEVEAEAEADAADPLERRVVFDLGLRALRSSSFCACFSARIRSFSSFFRGRNL